MTPIIDSVALVDIASSAARSMLLGGIAACALAAFRVRETSARLFTWKAVLYIALGMFFLMRAFPGISVPVPSLLRPAKTESAATQLSEYSGSNRRDSTADPHFDREECADLEKFAETNGYSHQWESALIHGAGDI